MRTGRNNLRLPIAFLSVFALGVWLGAAWHASTHELTDFLDHALTECACHSHDHSPQIENSENHHECPVCQTGLLSPIIQSAIQIIAGEVQISVERPHHAAVEVRAVAINLPPQRGPPASSLSL